jgi:hypothetical protein
MRSLLIGAACVLAGGLGFSQFEGPRAGVPVTDEPPAGVRPPQPPPLSPPAKTSITLDGMKITINYSAPSRRKRVIFGGLVPYNKVWRAGANDATLLHTSADLELKGLVVPKGDYSLFVWLDPQQWQLIINQEIRQSGLEYHQERDLGRVAMNISRPAKPIETYKITLTKTADTEGQLKMAWEKTVATAGFVVRAPR